MELTRKPSSGGGLRGLLTTRRGTVIVALACAAAAALVFALAISRYRQSVSSSSRQTTVLVARGMIQKGTSGNAIAAQLLYAPTQILGKQAAAGAIVDAAFLQGKIAAQNILPGQQLTQADFAPTNGPAGQLTPDQRAIAVPLDSAHGLAGVLQAGDHVDVYVGVSGTNGGTPIVHLLVPNVEVLSTPGAAASGTAASGNVLLAINDNQAATVAYAADNGKIWLTLRPGNASNPTQATASLDSLLAGTSSTGGRRQR